MFKEEFMSTVRDIIRAKGGEIWSVTPEMSVYDAMTLMAEKNVGALLVMQAEKVVGIASERDFVRKVDLKQRASQNTTIKDIMTSDVITIQASEKLEECMEKMIEKNIRHLPVYDGDKLLGLISVRDVLKEVVEVQKSLIAQLERYITGGGR
jgi:CBS domain-containing protein